LLIGLKVFVFVCNLEQHSRVEQQTPSLPLAQAQVNQPASGRRKAKGWGAGVLMEGNTIFTTLF
jgi:hypothetical protein